MLIGRHFAVALCAYQHRLVTRRRPGQRDRVIQPRISAVANTAKRPFMVPLRAAMRPPWMCFAVGLPAADFCQRVFMASSGQYTAGSSGRYDDAWCRVYGPRGSPEYLQCRENNYYTRLSVPIRATK